MGSNISSMDRLSGLPDDVICHILSFLPTKNSVQTCILAKRWRSLWARVPCLAFDDHDYSIEGSMSHIIYRVMLLRTKGVSINTFYLNHQVESCISFEFETWIIILIAHNVQNMDILLGYQFNLPQCLFSCKTLVDLLLTDCCVAIPNTGIVELPSLKKLRLVLISYETENSLANLLSGCPVLEELSITRESSVNSLVSCNISSPTLKRLGIYSDFYYVDNMKWYEVKFNTPALTFLWLHDFVSNGYSPGALTSLKEADVHFRPKRDDLLYSRSVLEFIGAMFNVKFLKLSTRSMEVEDSAFSAVLSMKFQNLTNLVLDQADWHFISFFLENAENIEVLNIRMFDGRIKNWMEPNQVPVCVSSHLRNVTIRDFGFTKGEFKLVRYLLRNAKVMKRMEIHDLEYGDGELDAAVKRISKYCRGSEACELVFL